MGSELFQPIVDQSRPEMVMRQLRGMIADGSLSEGQQLIEVELVSGFGVSRSTVREALQRLVQEGLIISVPHKGVFVREISDADVIDIYQARRVLETAAAIRLASSGDTEKMRALRDSHAEMTAAVRRGDHREMTTADQRFHDVLVDSIGSARIERLGGTLRLETRLCLARLEGRYAGPLEAVDEHLAIIDAIDAQDLGQIVHTVDTHMDNAVALLLEVDNIDAAPAASDASAAATAGEFSAPER